MAAPSPTGTVTRNGRSFRVYLENPSYIKFWDGVNSGKWEPRTFEVFDQFIHPHTTFLDVGGWIGPTSLYGAQRAAQTYTFEPDRVAHAELVRNVACNSDTDWSRRITVLNKALTVETGTIRMGCNGNVGGSLSSTLMYDADSSWTVETISFTDFLASYGLQGKSLFIKMDIEGGEYDLLPQIRSLLQNTDSVLHLSLHPRLLQQRLRRDSQGLLRSVKRRTRLVKMAAHLFETLPFRYLYRTNGRPLHKPAELVRALLTGKTSKDVVATNEKWKAA